MKGGKACGCMGCMAVCWWAWWLMLISRIVREFFFPLGSFGGGGGVCGGISVQIEGGEIGGNVFGIWGFQFCIFDVM